MRRVGVAIIGCGQIAQVAHLPNILKNPDARLISAVDLEKNKLVEVQRKFGCKNLSSSYEEVLRDPALDAVIICTPTSSHKEIAIKAAEAGKHIFCEKPLAVNSEEARDIISVAEKNNVKLMVGHFLRFLPNHVKTKALMRDGKIGEIFFAHAYSEVPGPYSYPPSHFFFNKNSGGGVLLDYGTHLIDILCWLFDDQKITKISGLTYSFNNLQVENSATLILQFSNGVLGQAICFGFLGKAGMP